MSYPSRPVKFIVLYPPGALTDLLARSLAERVRASLNQPVVVDNKPGAGTLIGAEFVAKQPADGYTLLMATSTTLRISPALYPKSPIDPVRDFAPIAMVGQVTTAALPQIKAGKVAALGTSGAKQTMLVSGVPPIGGTVPGFEALAWQGIVAPAGTRKEIVDKLNGEFNKIIDSDEFKQQLTKFGMEPNPLSAEEFAALIKSDAVRWADAVKRSGAKVD